MEIDVLILHGEFSMEIHGIPRNSMEVFHTGQLDVALLNTWLKNNKHKFFSGIHDCNEEHNDEENELSNGDENTPEEDDLDD